MGLAARRVGEDEAAQAVTSLNYAYPTERWVAAESWRRNLTDRTSFMGAIFPSVRFQYRKDLWVLGQELRRDKNEERRGGSLTGSRWLPGRS